MLRQDESLSVRRRRQKSDIEGDHVPPGIHSKNDSPEIRFLDVADLIILIENRETTLRAVIKKEEPLRVILGVDHLSGQNSGWTQFAVGTVPDVLGTRPKIEALPFKIGVAYQLFPFLYVKANAQYYFARCSYLYRYEKGSYWQEWQGNARAGGLGASLAAGGEWEFYPGVFLVGEAQFRFARIGGFKGKSLTLNSYGESYTEDGVLYTFRTQGTGDADFPIVFIRSDVPSEPGVSDPRRATVDFSGMSIRTGIRIRF